jgi:hypothetical protein
MVLSLLTVALVTGAALVGATTDAPSSSDDPSVVLDELNDHAGEDDAGAGGEGHAVENHGRCVSQAVAAAKQAGLHGRYKGAFVGAIAADEALVAAKDELGEACDFADELDAALAEQEAAEASEPAKEKPSHTKDPKEHPGKGPKHDGASDDDGEQSEEPEATE